MNIFRRVAQMLHGTRVPSGSPQVQRTPRTSTDWRQERLAQAAKKYGKPFKCASDSMPREVIVGGKHLVSLPSSSGAARSGDAAQTR